MEIHAIQYWDDDEVWRTAYMSSYAEDADDLYHDIQAYSNRTLRRVVFGVDNYDFVAIHARDFKVLALRQVPLQTP